MKAKKIVPRIIRQSQAQVEAEAHAYAAEAREAMNALARAAQAGDTEAEQIFRETAKEMAQVHDAAKAEARHLKSEPAAIQGARLQQQWRKFNRSVVSDILSNLRQIQLPSNSSADIRDVGKDLFYVIEQAREKLLSLTDAPGIISQSELEAVKRETDQWHVGCGRDTAFFVNVRDLVARYRAGWLVEAGNLKLTPSQNELICVSASKEAHLGQFHNSYSVQTEKPVSARTDTPSPAQLQAWFDLPNKPRHAEGSPSES